MQRGLSLGQVLRPPGEAQRHHLAAGKDRLDLAAELAEAIHLKHGGINSSLLKALKGRKSTYLHAEQSAKTINRKLFAGLEFHVATLLHHFIKRERVFAAEGKHNLLLQACILRTLSDNTPHGSREGVKNKAVAPRGFFCSGQQLNAPCEGFRTISFSCVPLNSQLRYGTHEP